MIMSVRSIVLRAAPPPKMIILDWPLGIPEPNFQAGGVAAELDLRSAFIPSHVLVLHATPVHARVFTGAK